MSELSGLISEYLAFRKARGLQPNRKLERLLVQFADALPPDRPDGRLFTQGQALTWAHARPGAAPAWLAYRLSAVRGFAVYLAGSDLPVDVPGTRQGPSGSRRATPYLFTKADVQAVMRAAEELFTPLRAATMSTLVGMMAVTGMRIGEALRLTIAHLDLDQGRSNGLVLIAHAKFGRQRLVQLAPSSCQAVTDYLRLPVRRRLGVTPDRPVFLTTRGAAVHERTAHGAFHQMTRHAGLRPRAGARPRPHALRHTFATQTMIDAYRAGRDPARTLTLLSVWLGHANPADTYWYLQAAPEVAALAALRLEPDADNGES
jgi:integrase